VLDFGFDLLSFIERTQAGGSTAEMWRTTSLPPPVVEHFCELNHFTVPDCTAESPN
jgi:hypothetical protein